MELGAKIGPLWVHRDIISRDSLYGNDLWLLAGEEKAGPENCWVKKCVFGAFLPFRLKMNFFTLGKDSCMFIVFLLVSAKLKPIVHVMIFFCFCHMYILCMALKIHEVMSSISQRDQWVLGTDKEMGENHVPIAGPEMTSGGRLGGSRIRGLPWDPLQKCPSGRLGWNPALALRNEEIAR